MALKTSLSFLSKGTRMDHSSSVELSKFGLVKLDNWKFSNNNANEASSSSSSQPSSQKQNIQIQFGPFSPRSLSGMVTAESHNNLALMEHFLTQAESKENQVIECLLLGNFKCPLNVPYPPLPLCFLNSAFKYAPPHDFWPPFLSA